MNKKIAVLGTGAIGSSIAADLTKVGYDVMLIDQWPAHVEYMKTYGLNISMPGEEFRVPVRAFHLCELSAVRPQLDIILLAAKSYDTCWMIEFIKPYLKLDGIIVSIQNSFNDEWIAPIIGYQRDIASAIELSAEIFEPGLVKRLTDRNTTWFILGELHGRITPRLQEVANILSAVGRTKTSTNIWGAKWSKLVLNSMTPFDTILGGRTPELMVKPEVLDCAIKLARETAQVATTLGYTLEPILGLTEEDFMGLTDTLFKKLLITLMSDVSKGSRARRGVPSRSVGSHATQDILKGRRTEMDYINGLVVKKGREAKVPTPFNEAVTLITRQIEQGILKPDISNLQVMQHCVSGLAETCSSGDVRQ